MFPSLFLSIFVPVCVCGVDDHEQPGGEEIVAVVGSLEITRDDVAKVVDQRFPNADRLPEERLQAVRRAAASTLVRRQLALERLLQLGGKTLRARIDRRIELELASLARTTETPELTDGRRQDLAWILAWNEYLRDHLTEQNLKSFFQVFAWKFDGTAVHLSQIFLPPGPSAEEDLSQLQHQIAAGQLTFADAARQHSQSPSADNGGEIGWVRYHGDVPTAVAQAAFDADLKTVVGPILSTAGWHLLWVENRRSGDVPFDQVVDRAAIRREAADYLFERLVAAGTQIVDVQWVDDAFAPNAATGKTP
jgi:peptidyl-prolyl cis-trans isomerase C